MLRSTDTTIYHLKMCFAQCSCGVFLSDPGWASRAAIKESHKPHLFQLTKLVWCDASHYVHAVLVQARVTSSVKKPFCEGPCVIKSCKDMIDKEDFFFVRGCLSCSHSSSSSRTHRVIQAFLSAGHPIPQFFWNGNYTKQCFPEGFVSQ